MKYNNRTWLLEKILGEGGHDAINKYFSEKAAAEEHRRREAERKRREAEARREAERKRREEEARREAERKRREEEARREAERKRKAEEARREAERKRREEEARREAERKRRKAEETRKTYEKYSLKKTITRSGEVNALAIHKDTIISGTYKEIKLWTLEGQCIRTLRGHSSYVYALAVHKDTIISGSKDKMIKLWPSPYVSVPPLLSPTCCFATSRSQFVALLRQSRSQYPPNQLSSAQPRFLHYPGFQSHCCFFFDVYAS